VLQRISKVFPATVHARALDARPRQKSLEAEISIVLVKDAWPQMMAAVEVTVCSKPSCSLLPSLSKSMWMDRALGGQDCLNQVRLVSEQERERERERDR
jgi:hypothetical protein